MLSNEELLQMVRERGLIKCSTSEQISPIKGTLKEDLIQINQETQEIISQAGSVNFIPSKAKTELLDVVINHLLKITR